MRRKIWQGTFLGFLGSIALLGAGAPVAFAGTADELASLPTLDALDRAELPLSNGGKWTALKWAEGPYPTGEDTTTGWVPKTVYPKTNGAFWSPVSFSDASGDAAAVTMATRPALSGYSSIWLNMGSPGSAKSGYQLRWTNAVETIHTVKLSKWSAGTETVLASQSVHIPNGSTLAISDTGTSVTAWLSTGGAFTPVVSAVDSTYSNGYAGIEAPFGRLLNFKAGSLIGYKLANLPVTDALDRNEEPLSNGGKWTALNWAGGTKPAGKDTTEGWGSVDSFPTINGAYWNWDSGTLTDAGGWDAATLTMSKKPATYDHNSAVWLNMPDPAAGKSGYALRWSMNWDTTTYTLNLEKWSSGTRTVLDWEYVNISSGTTLALVDEGGTVAGYLGSGSSFEKVLSASDSAYSSGYAGMEGAGTTARHKNFKAGSLTSYKLANLPVADALDRAEVPLSGGGDWSALNWSAGSKPTGQDTTEGWSAYDSFPTINGAYWVNGTLSDAGGWDAASLTMKKKPTTYDHNTAVWLNMPSPGTAKSGYALRWSMNWDTLTYALNLEKWVAGTRTVLAWRYIHNPVGTTHALVDEGGVVSAWMGSNGSFVRVLSASDSTYSSGRVGIEGAGTISRSGDFRIGTKEIVAPDTTISTGSSTGNVPPNVAFSFSSGEPGATFQCKMDGGSYSSCTSPKSYTGLSEAQHTFRVRAVGGGGTDETPAQRSVQVKSAANAIGKTPLRDNLEREEMPLSTPTFSKPAWAPEKGYIRIDGGYHGWGSNEYGVAAAYWNPTTYNSSAHSAQVAASIGTGANWEGERLGLWLHLQNSSERTGYEARFLPAGSVNTYKVELSKWVSGSRTVLATKSSQVIPVGGVIAISESGGNITVWGAASGIYSQLATAVDTTFNSGYAGMEVSGVGPKEYNFRAGQIDLQAPETSITQGPTGKVSNESVVFGLSSTEGHQTFECKMDGGAYATCGPTSEYPGLTEGVHVFKARAIDGAGNVDATPVERIFEVFDPPNTTITSPQPSFLNNERPPVTFISDEAESTFECSLSTYSNPQWPSYSACTSPYTLPQSLEDKVYYFRVRAKDKTGYKDLSSATWAFRPGIYADAPATSKLISPEEGEKSGSYYTLNAKWENAPEGGGVTGITFQAKFYTWQEFRTIPAKYLTDAQGDPISWPLPAKTNPGETGALFLDMTRYASEEVTPPWGVIPGYPEEELRFRAIFDGGVNAAGASQPVSVDFSRDWGGSSDATAQISPVNLNLLTGKFTLSRTDVSIPVPGSEANLEFTRVYNSIYNYSGGSAKSRVLGKLWEPSVPAEQAYTGEAWISAAERHQDAMPAEYDEECLEEEYSAEDCLLEDAIPAADWVEIRDNEGVGIVFDKIGGAYVAPEYAKDFVLTKEGNTFTLADPDNTRTTFVQNEVGYTNEYRAKTVSWQASEKSVRLVYENDGSAHVLKKMIAPPVSDVECPDATAETKVGCRTLTFQYEEFNFDPNPSYYEDRLVSITYHNATGVNPKVVARYSYTEDGRLAAEWDPRITPNLTETYSYEGSYLKTVTPPGGESWEFDYYDSPYWVRKPLKSISRASLLESTPTATTTIAYNVPVTGEDAPYEMGPETVAEWGQADYPVDATAIFPPTQVPDEPPSDYSQAVVHYLDPDGYQVNSAFPSVPGVEAASITTSETDGHGNVVRGLSAGNRLAALEAEDPIGRSKELDSHSTYNAEGTRLLESWGPLHEVKLESGTVVEARTHTTIEYDKGFEGDLTKVSLPNLPTKETVGAAIPGQEGDKDVRVSETKYDWNLRLPIEGIVDPGGLNLVRRSFYNSAGQLTETRQPGNKDGGGAGSTITEYYKATGAKKDNPCYENPEWAGLPCVTHPAAPPSPTGGNPQMAWTWFTGYSSLDLPTEVQEKTNGVLKRKTTITYDSAGRTVKVKQEGEGSEVPAVESTYDEDTGGLVGQHLVCEKGDFSCAEFDNQEVSTEYDTLGRAVKYVDADGNVSENVFDLMGRAVLRYDGKGTQAMSYDEDSGTLVEVNDSAAGAVKATYDVDGEMTELLLPNGLVQRSTYDETGSRVAMSFQKESYCSSNCTWLEFSQQRSIHGQVLAQQSNLSSEEYQYDRIGRLVTAKQTPQGQGCTTRTYAYDANSNRASTITRAPKAGGGCDTESTGVKRTSTYDSADRLTGTGIVYDGLGRTTSLSSAYSGGGTLSSSYYVNDQIRSQTQDGLTNTYELDSTGRQRLRTESGAKVGIEIYHYAGTGDSVAWIEEGESQWSRNIGLGGGVGAIEESSGEITLQLADMHGDIVATADIDPEADELLATQSFDEFGVPLQGDTAKFGWLGGKGRRTEFPSGVIQMGVRSYVPSMGRFLSPDPVPGGSANAYDYSNADPVNDFDLSGEKPHANDRGAGCELKLHIFSKKTRHGKHKQRGRMHTRIILKCTNSRAVAIGAVKLEIRYEKTRDGCGIAGTKKFCTGPYCRMEADCMDFKGSGPDLSDPDGRSMSLEEFHDCEYGVEYQLSVTLPIRLTSAAGVVGSGGGRAPKKPGQQEGSVVSGDVKKDFFLQTQEVCGHGKY
jgi:RHS repeat-associated protein